ncbi:MAG: 3'-5' exonuclease, partial [Pseudomonadota bacterium]
HQAGEAVSAYETILTHLFDAQRRWRTNHFGDAFRFLIRAFGIDTYVLRLAEGERTLTNLFHLGEYLAALSAREGLGCERLMSWLQNRLETPRPDDEAAMVRPDTDESMVQVVTIHASKGLEYPVVFCPFGWAGSGRRVGGTLTYHAPDHERTPVLDVGPDFDDQTIDTAREEERAEDVRLLYVGLTRAMHRLYLSVSFARDYEKSALAWLLHADEDESLSAFEQRVKSSDPGILWSDVEALRSAGKRGIALYEPPSGQLSLLGAQAPARYRARRVGRTFDVSRVLTSHSGIVAGRHREEPDYDDAPEDRDEFDAEGESIHSFPRGAVAGSCLHRILEDIDFAATDASTFAHPIQSALQSYGIDIGWAAMLHGWFAELASVPLDRAGTVTLQSACGKPLGREVEFHYPLRGADENEIHRVLERFDPNLPTESRPARQIPAGFLKGFIDLVFEVDGRYYVADYKSNWLGASIDAYHPRALQSAMTTHSYDLQALFYSVALHRFLKMRLADYQPSEHFGGAVYLFLRGLSRSAPRSHSVVWMTPTPDTLQFAEEVICGAG